MKTFATIAALVTCLCAAPVYAASFIRMPIVPHARIANGGLSPAGDTTPAASALDIVTTPEASYAAAPGVSYILWQTVKNTGSASATIALADVRNVTGGFALLDDQCSGVTLAPGATCKLGVKFSPPAVGSFSAEVEVLDPQNHSTQATLLADAVDGLRSLQFSVAGPQPGQSCNVHVLLNGIDFSPDLEGYRVILAVTSQVSASKVLGGFSFSVIAP